MKLLHLSIILLTFTTASAQISVSDNGRYLTTKDGKPFFWLGDTDWELFHRLTREEIVNFMDVRSAQGFNVIHAVALAEFNGIRQPNRYGDVPLNNEDPAQLLITPGNNPGDAYEYDYWDHVDFAIAQAAQRGMYIGLLPTWGDKVTPKWGDGPVVFNEQNAEVYARTLAKHVAGQWNILWILGGDRPPLYKAAREGAEKEYDDRALWRAMARGIESVLGKEAFITYHPWGGALSTSQYIHTEPWLDINAFQSGHGARETPAWDWVTRDLALSPPKPTLDMEPCYEDHPVNPWDGKWTRARGYFSAYDVRARIYRDIFAGACGVTYGHHQVWQFLNSTLYPPINIGDTLIGWEKALRAEGATELIYLKRLMLSRPYFTRIPDQTILKSDGGPSYFTHVVATRDTHGTYAMIYLPQNKPVKIDHHRITGDRKTVWWFNPRTGQAKTGQPLAAKSTTVTLTPPAEGKDWVLIIDDASKNYPSPGGQ